MLTEKKGYFYLQLILMSPLFLKAVVQVEGISTFLWVIQDPTFKLSKIWENLEG